MKKEIKVLERQIKDIKKDLRKRHIDRSTRRDLELSLRDIKVEIQELRRAA